jgi:predicted site-specific integrase-resolvase
MATNDGDGQRLLTTGEAARRLVRSAEAVRLYVRVGRLPAMRTLGGQLIFREPDVARLEAELARAAKERRPR